MAYSTPVLKEFIRKVFRDATTAAGADPLASGHLTAQLDVLSDAALGVKSKGKVLTGSTDNMGVSASWQMLSRMGSHDQQIELVDAARDVIADLVDVDAALAKVARVTRVGNSFARYGLYS